MVKILILTHGRLAESLLDGAETIAGKSPWVSALSLAWDDDLPAARQKVSTAIGQLDLSDGLLILTDMYGGTPHNVATSLAEPGRIEVVAGVNLPMVLRLECMSSNDLPVADLANWIATKGRRSIRRGSPNARPLDRTCAEVEP